MDVQTQEFACLDWVTDGASITVGGTTLALTPSPYGLGVAAFGPLRILQTVESLGDGSGRLDRGAHRRTCGRTSHPPSVSVLRVGRTHGDSRFARGVPSGRRNRRNRPVPGVVRSSRPVPSHRGWRFHHPDRERASRRCRPSAQRRRIDGVGRDSFGTPALDSPKHHGGSGTSGPSNNGGGPYRHQAGYAGSGRQCRRRRRVASPRRPALTDQASPSAGRNRTVGRQRRGPLRGTRRGGLARSE